MTMHSDPWSLKGLLLKLQTRLPHNIRLPADPNEEVWKYYYELGCCIFSKDKNLISLDFHSVIKLRNYFCNISSDKLTNSLPASRTGTSGSCEIPNYDRVYSFRFS